MSKKKDVKIVKKSVFFNFFQVHKKLATFLIIGVGFLGFFLAMNYGRYVKDIIEVYYLRSQNFYFNSDKLTIHGKTYEINPWGGTIDYGINVNMNSLLNSIKGTSVPITYDVTCEGDDKVDCYFDTLGTRELHNTIDVEDHADSFVVTVTPRNGVSFTNGERVSVTVVATSTSPYKETLSATFELVIGDYGLNFEIEDVAGSVYFDALVTNTLDTTSAMITLTIPDDYIDSIYFDMTNPIMQQDSFTSSTSTVNGDEYITKVTFLLEPKSSLLVKYYKNDSTKNYSYVLGDTSKTPVIDFDVQKIE